MPLVLEMGEYCPRCGNQVLERVDDSVCHECRKELNKIKYDKEESGFMPDELY